MSVEHLAAAAGVPAIARDFRFEPYTFGSFTFTAIGLTVAGTPQLDEWAAVGAMLATQVRGLQFMVGDWIRIGESLYGELAAQAIDARQWTDETVRNYLWVAKSVPVENRREDLTFKHHQVVAHLAPDDQRTWLKRAALDDNSGPWSTNRLKTALIAGGDVAVSGWCVLVEAKDEPARDALLKELTLAGHQCKAVERRGGRRVGD